MKYIEKDPEPKELGYWKAEQRGINCDYENLSNDLISILNQAFLQEQGYICCYCCQRIKTDTSHNEHLLPQSRYSELSLTYSNIMASCGSQLKWPKHCGNKKGNREIKVSPLQPNCEQFFTYTEEGEIRPANNLEQNDAAQETIDILGLNDYDLREGRRQAIEFLHQKFEALTITEAQKLARKIRARDATGKYQPFWATISYYLNRYYGA